MQIAIDMLTFTFETKESTNKDDFTVQAEEGCYVYGLYCDGFRFDLEKMTMEDQNPSEMYTDAPIILFTSTFIPSKPPMTEEQ